jgi:hypothetical protein
MTDFDHLLERREDDLDRSFIAALSKVPASEQPIEQEIWRLVRETEGRIANIHADLRDCNVILARTVDKLQRFNATHGFSYDG